MDVVRKTLHLTYMNKYIVMFSYENMMSAHIPIFAVLLLDQRGADPGFLKRGGGGFVCLISAKMF